MTSGDIARVTDTLYTATAVAQQLGISRQAVTERAIRRNIGHRPVKGVWLFTDADIAALAPMRPGRPADGNVPAGVYGVHISGCTESADKDEKGE